MPPPDGAPADSFACARPTLPQVATLAMPRQGTPEAFKRAAGERAAALLARTHPDVRSLCRKVRVPAPSADGAASDVEVDEIILSDACAFVLEANRSPSPLAESDCFSPSDPLLHTCCSLTASPWDDAFL